MKHSIRAFAIGLFSAGIILLIVHYFSNESTQDFSEMPVEDVITELKEEGYRVLTESEFITLTVNNDPNELESSEEEVVEEEADSNDELNNDEESNEEDVAEETETTEETNVETEAEDITTYTLTIESGMPSSSIGDILVEQGIIDDASELTQYLDEEEYSLRIQLGDFTVSSDMSFYEIAETITR